MTQTADAIAVIPARIASKRLPRKVLVDIVGKPMIQHVYERVYRARTVQRVIVATDSEEVVRIVEGWGGEAILTDPDLPSGTARIASIIDQIGAEVVVNVQGDQPLVEPDLIDELVRSFGHATADIVTAVWPIKRAVDLTNPAIAKVVRARDGRALYFSRSPIPYVRDADPVEWPQKAAFWGHYGIYCFRRQVLLDFNHSLPPSQLEQAEKLEQLRFLEAGYRIHTIETIWRQVAVDTVEDLRHVREMSATPTHTPK